MRELQNKTGAQLETKRAELCDLCASCTMNLANMLLEIVNLETNHYMEISGDERTSPEELASQGYRVLIAKQRYHRFALENPSRECDEFTGPMCGEHKPDSFNLSNCDANTSD